MTVFKILGKTYNDLGVTLPHEQILAYDRLVNQVETTPSQTHTPTMYGGATSSVKEG